jgi:hypothetical protein
MRGDEIEYGHFAGCFHGTTFDSCSVVSVVSSSVAHAVNAIITTKLRIVIRRARYVRGRELFKRLLGYQRAMPFTLDAVHAYAMKLPDVTVGARWGNKTWLVGERGFLWDRPLGKRDVERLVEAGAAVPSAPTIAVRTESLDAKDALLSMDLPGFFTIEHFNNYAAVLIELKKARTADVKMAIEQGYRAMAAMGPAKKKKKPAQRSRRANARKAKPPTKTK